MKEVLILLCPIVRRKAEHSNSKDPDFQLGALGLLKLGQELAEKLEKVRSFENRYMLIGFSGWPDAGKVASLTISFFTRSLRAEKLLDVSEFYDLTANRPMVEVKDGLIERLTFPEAAIFSWTGGSHSLLIYGGPEPGYDWTEFAESLLKLCEAASIQRIYLVGGVLDNVPHTRQPRISAVVNMEHLKLEAKIYGLDLTNYSGPASIHSYLMLKAGEKGLEAVGLWGHSPNYLPYPNAIVAYHLSRKLAEMMKLQMSFEELEKMAEDLRRRLDDLRRENPEFARLVEQLERKYDEEYGGPTYIA